MISMSDSCAAWAIFRPIKSFHSLSLWIMSLSHHSTKLGTIHMSHRLIPLISTLFHPLQCSFTHFLNNSQFSTSFHLCQQHSPMLAIISCRSPHWPSYALTARQSGETNSQLLPPSFRVWLLPVSVTHRQLQFKNTNYKIL